MSTSVPRELVKAFYQVYTVHDADKVAEFLADDVMWSISGPVDVLPYCGVRHGKAAVIELIKRDLPALFVPIVLSRTRCWLTAIGSPPCSV